MNRTFKNAVLAGCCSLGMVGYAQKHDVKQNTGPQQPQTISAITGNTYSVADQEAAQFFSSEYKFMPYQLVNRTVDMVEARIKNPAEPVMPIAIPLGHSIDEGGISRHLVTSRMNVGDKKIVAFNAAQSVRNAQSADDDVLLAPVGRSYLAYRVGLLDSLTVQQRTFNEKNGMDIRLMVSMENGFGAMAIRERFEGKLMDVGSVLMSGELLAQLEVQEAIAIHGHELGHFEYARMKDDAERRQRLGEMLHDLGYKENDIPQLESVGEELYADIYAMKNLVEKYGDSAKDIMQGAMVKMAALHMGHKPHAETVEAKGGKAKGDKANPPENSRDLILKQMYEQQMDMMMLENDHPHILVRMDVVDRAAQHYLKK